MNRGMLTFEVNDYEIDEKCEGCNCVVHGCHELVCMQYAYGYAIWLWTCNKIPWKKYLLWHKPIRVESHRIGQLLTIQVKICIAYPSKGHVRSPEVTNCHLTITFDPKELET